MPKSKQAPEKPKLSYNENLERLESVISHIENDETSLEEALKLFEEGVGLTRSAQDVLSKAEQHVQKLMEKDGEPVSSDFSLDDNDQ